MADSWESALSYVRGEHVILLGADDALLPSTLAALDYITGRFPSKVISWPTAHYHWPTSPSASKRNILQVPLGTSVKERNGHAALREVAKFRTGYETLPMLYNSCVPRPILDRLLRDTGRVIHASSPDVVSGMALAAISGKYLRLGFPLSVAGVSGTSNGGSSTQTKQSGTLKDSTPIGEFYRMNSAAGLGMHASLPDVPLGILAVADAFLRVKEVTGLPSSIRLCRHSLMEHCFREACLFSDPIRTQIQQVLCEYFHRVIPPNSIKNVSNERFPSQIGLGYQPRCHSLNVNLEDFGITDVHGAAVHCARLVEPMSLMASNPDLLSGRVALRIRLKQALKTLLGLDEGEFF